MAIARKLVINGSAIIYSFLPLVYIWCAQKIFPLCVFAFIICVGLDIFPWGI